MTDQGLRLVIAEDRNLQRAALAAAFGAQPEFVVSATVGSGAAALRAVKVTGARLTLVGSELDQPAALETCRRLSRDGVVILVDDQPSTARLHAALDVGVNGYVTMEMSLSDIVDAAHRVWRGQTFVPPTMLGPLLAQLLGQREATDVGTELLLRLTRREREILELLAEGCDQVAMAEILVISPQTARTHIQNVIKKLGVHSRLGAVSMAVQYGWVKPQGVVPAQ